MLPPGMPETRDLIQCREEVLANGSYTRVTIARPAWVFFLGTEGTIYFAPHVQPSADAIAFQFVAADKALYLWAGGDWYIKQSTGAIITVRLGDGGNPYAPSATAGGAEPMNLASIGGTAQTGLDLMAAYIAPATFAKATPFALTAGDSAMLAANAARKLLTIVNKGTSWAAIGAKASALTAFDDAAVFLVLPPNSVYKFQKPSEPPPVAAIRVFTDGALSTVYMQEGS